MALDPIQAKRINKVFADNCGYDNVKDWLFGLGLGQYFELFVDNGYDCFRICSEIKTVDIETLGITDQYHIELLVKGVQRMNNPKAKSVYYRLSASCFDDNDIRSLSNELNSNSAHSESTLTNGFNSPKITQDYYLKKPTLAEKRLVRSKLVELQVDLAESKYCENSLHLDALAEHISEHLQIDELHVYDILCHLKGITKDKLSPTTKNLSPITKSQTISEHITNGEVAPTRNSSEDVFFSPISSLPISDSVSAPKPVLRPKKPPRSFQNPEEKISQSSPVHIKKPDVTPINSYASLSVSEHSEPTEPTADSAYDILHSDNTEPIIMPTTKSPSKLKLSTKSDEAPPPDIAPFRESECLYFELEGHTITENSIGPPVRSKSLTTVATNSIFKRSKILKNQITLDEPAQNSSKKPPSQPPPPPPASSMLESDNSSKHKPEKGRKHSSTFYTDNVEPVDNIITESYSASETKGKKTGGFFRMRSTKPKAEVKKGKKSKDESDLKETNLKDSIEVEKPRPVSKILYKSSDNLTDLTNSDEKNFNDENNSTAKSPKKYGLSMLPPEANKEIQKRLLSDQHLKSEEPVSTAPTSNFPQPIARRRNSPEESTNSLGALGYKPQSPRDDVKNFCSQTLPRVSTTPPPKPKRVILEEILYDNIEQPNPAPRVKKIDYPLTSLPELSNPTSSRSQLPDVVVNENQPQPVATDHSTASLVRVKPELPKGKKPVLKKKPSKDSCVHVREKSTGDNTTATPRENKLKTSDSGPALTRISSPLTAPPPPTTKRPENPPEPPPIHLIPSLRPVAHVRPTKPPIITPPSAGSSSPVAEPRNPENWKRIEEKIYTILKEEDFIDYLITHYTDENGESKITAGLVNRLSNETSFAMHHVATALDNIRLTRLIELGRNAVPISLQEFDTKDTLTDTDTVSNWLTSIGLPIYIEVFYEHIKNTNEIKDLDPDDLVDFGVITKHRGYLYSAIEILQSSNSK